MLLKTEPYFYCCRNIRFFIFKINLYSKAKLLST